MAAHRPAEALPLAPRSPHRLPRPFLRRRALRPPPVRALPSGGRNRQVGVWSVVSVWEGGSNGVVCLSVCLLPVCVSACLYRHLLEGCRRLLLHHCRAGLPHPDRHCREWLPSMPSPLAPSPPNRVASPRLSWYLLLPCPNQLLFDSVSLSRSLPRSLSVVFGVVRPRPSPSAAQRSKGAVVGCV